MSKAAIIPFLAWVEKVGEGELIKREAFLSDGDLFILVSTGSWVFFSPGYFAPRGPKPKKSRAEKTDQLFWKKVLQ